MIDEKFIVDKYLKVPFKHQGRDMNGLDCYGLLIAIYADLGIKLFDVEEDYSPDWSFEGKNYFIENCHRDWVEVKTPELFDIAIFKNKDVVNHAGVMFDSNRFINACKMGIVVCKLSEGVWGKRFVGFFRHKDLIK